MTSVSEFLASTLSVPTVLLAVGMLCIMWLLFSRSLRECAQWLRGPRSRYCASLWCIMAPSYSVVSKQRAPASRFCYQHAVYQRAMMILDGDTGAQILDRLLDDPAQRRERHALEAQRLQAMMDPKNIELPTWGKR